MIQARNRMHDDRVIERYAIGGAVGATFYLEPLATLDVDVLVAMEPHPGSLVIDPQPVLRYLTRQGYHIEGEHVVIGG